MLVLRKERVVAVHKVGETAAEVGRVLNWRTVAEWTEEVLFECENEELLKNLVSHQIPLGRTRRVSVAVVDAHASKARDVSLHRNIPVELHIPLGFLSRMNARRVGRVEDVEALVPYFVDHF